MLLQLVRLGAATFITTNVTDAGTTGTHAAIVEADVTAVAESTWNAGGNPSTILLGATNKKLITAMTGRARRLVQLLMTTILFTTQLMYMFLTSVLSTFSWIDTVTRTSYTS